MFVFGLACANYLLSLTSIKFPFGRDNQKVQVETRMDLNGYQRTKKKDDFCQEDMLKMSHDEEIDPWTAWAYKPRTVTLLLVGACLLM